MAVELIAMIIRLITTANNLAMQQLIQDKVCVGLYSQSRDFCNNISDVTSDHIKDNVMSDTAYYSSMKEYIIGIPGLVLLLFVGSWCDRYSSGHRTVIMLSIASILVTCLLLIACNVFFDLHVVFVPLANLPYFIASGSGVACTSYVIAKSTTHNRSSRLLLLAAATRTGTVIGFFISGFLMNQKSLLIPSSESANSTDNVFLMSFAIAIIAIIWTMIMVRPSRSQRITNSGIFSFSDLTETLQTLIKGREAGGRTLLLIHLIMYACCIFPDLSMDLLYLPLTQILYQWNVQTLSRMLTITSACCPIAVLIVSFIVSRLKLNDCLIIVVGLMASLTGYLCLGNIPSVIGLYLFSAIASIAPIVATGIQSSLSHFLLKEELSKVYSIMQIVESTMAFASPAIASAIFSASVAVQPTIVIHCFAVVIAIALSLSFCVRRRQRINDDKSQSENSSQDSV